VPAMKSGSEGRYELQVAGAFAAAHRLRGYQGECERLHGHNWRVEAVFGGESLNDLGMLLDFREARRLLEEVLKQFDHCDLNQKPPFHEQNPTTENLARLVHAELSRRTPIGVRVESVTVWESDDCGVRYRP